MSPLEEPEDPDSVDESLLQRLNALRSSNIPPKLHLEPHSTDPPTDKVGTNDLAERFAKLGHRSFVPPKPEPDEAETFLNSINGDSGLSKAHSEEDDRSLEDLLSEIGPSKKWDVTEAGSDRATELLKQAREALSRSAAPKENNLDDDPQQHNIEEQKGKPSSEPVLTEEQEADNYIEQILAEIEAESQAGDLRPAEENAVNAHDQLHEDNEGLPELQTQKSGNTDDQVESILDYDTVFNLPAAPSHAPLESKSSNSNDKTEADFTLPSPPKSAPGSNVQKYSDDEIDTWCIICNDDAEVRCLGCDNDLYCSTCWFEGHRSKEAGLEERTHKAVAFIKPAPKQKQIEAA